jgi:hypothetical protein
MTTFANDEIERESLQKPASPEDDIAALLVDCHDFVEQVLSRRQSKAVQTAANQLLARLESYVKWETLH